MNQGQLLKKIRVSRRLSQQQLAQDITSQAALSRMEKSGNIDANVLLRFLDKLDIHPTEFFMLANPDGLIDSQDYQKKLYAAYYNEQNSQTLINQELLLYDKTKIKKHQINALRVQAVYAKINNLPLENREEITYEIQNYLFGFETWFLNDF
ncbi:helix-turn-helix domain-containing protein [Leuconostoc falkenbergense]|uniref:helix-turn-helix domain-containing protein n=1 Tax=Leuconostoc falkenbergense TaxID=2766470 RepID=UPI0022658004|nr:helix-turn-helix transcriptional regulator [Leuconostoc falkenbergense]